MIKIIKLPVARWREYRQIRLEALSAEPLAFGSSYAEEVGKKEDHWKADLMPGSFRKVYFAEIDGKIAGLAGLKFASHKKFAHIAKIGTVYVNQKYRGQGVGKMLLKQVIASAFRIKKIDKIKLTVNSSQKTALNLYTALGFKKVGVMKAEFKINGIYYDAILMELLRNK